MTIIRKKQEVLDLVSASDTGGLLDGYFQYVPDKTQLVPEPEKVGAIAAQVMKCGAPFILLRAPIMAGKSRTACKYIQNVMVSIPVSKKTGMRESNILVIRGTYQQLRIGTFQTWFGAWPQSIGYEWHKSDMRFETKFKLSDGSTAHSVVNFKALDGSEESLQTLEGYEGNAAFLDEAKNLSQPIFDRVNSRMRWPGDEHVGKENMRKFIILATNSFPKTNYLYDLFYVKNKDNPDFARFDYPSGESPDAEGIGPAGWVADDYYPDKKASSHPSYYRAYVLNEFVSARTGKSCYPSFTQRHNVIDRPANKNYPIWVGIDGGTDMAAAFFQDYGNGRQHIVDYFFVNGQDVDENNEKFGLSKSLNMLVEYAHQRYPISAGWKWQMGGHDPGMSAGNALDRLSGEHYLMTASNKYGVCKTMRTFNDGNKPTPRIQAVDSLFGATGNDGEKMLTIHNSPQCRPLIDSCDEYHYRVLSGQADSDSVIYSDHPNKGPESHGAECVQYGVGAYKGGFWKIAKSSFSHARNAAARVLKPYTPNTSSMFR